MADDAQNGSPRSDPIDAKEDAETAAARKELKHTVISEKSSADGATGATTPQLSANDDGKDQVSSPKKKQKRPHDQLDEDKDADEADNKSIASSDSAKDRALRLEPEKKRPRDEVTGTAGSVAGSSASSTVDAKKADTATNETTPATTDDSVKGEKKETSATAFASSGFAKLAASSSSPFGALGGSTKGSVFGGPVAATSPFGALSPPKPAASPSPAPTLSFGGADAAASPFASVNAAGANGFGSTFGSGFGSALSGKPLTSFAKAGESSFKSEKPAKPFGAPDSDAEDASEEEAEGQDGSASESGDKEEREESDKEEFKAADDKKRTKLQKITVDDGETGEATIVQVRAKMFYLEKGVGLENAVGWKERGSGMLKINVPEACLSFDDAGVPIPGSFDASGLNEDTDPEAGDNKSHKVARLIMRQDQTHRILLNTAILPVMNFQEKTSLKSSGVMFTAFEGDEVKPVSVHMRMSAASAKSFLNELGLVQRELLNK